MVRRSYWMIVLIAGVLVFAGCARQQQPAQAPTPPAPSAGAATEVQVTLTDFKVEMSQTEFEVGKPYRFVITNKGAIAHEFMIVPPMMSGMSVEETEQAALTEIKEDELPAGGTKTLEYTFTEPAPEGKLEIACHVEGHYEAGMRLPIIVK